MLLTRMLHAANHSSATASERPPHKETHAYGCCVSTLTRFVRPPLQRPLTGSRASICLSFVCRADGRIKALTIPVWNCERLDWFELLQGARCSKVPVRSFEHLEMRCLPAAGCGWNYLLAAQTARPSTAATSVVVISRARIVKRQRIHGTAART